MRIKHDQTMQQYEYLKGIRRNAWNVNIRDGMSSFSNQSWRLSFFISLRKLPDQLQIWWLKHGNTMNYIVDVDDSDMN